MALRFPMTPRGQQALRDELKRLREVERPKNVRDIEEARAHGDLKENAEYHAAKERQGFIEGRSKDIEAILAQAEVIDPAKLSGSRVVFGATVRLTDTDSGEDVTYSIVGDHEADIKISRISISAPLARAMIGKDEGDTITMKTGKGIREYQIVQVRFLAGRPNLNCLRPGGVSRGFASRSVAEPRNNERHKKNQGTDTSDDGPPGQGRVPLGSLGDRGIGLLRQVVQQLNHRGIPFIGICVQRPTQDQFQPRGHLCVMGRRTQVSAQDLARKIDERRPIERLHQQIEMDAAKRRPT